MALCFVMMVMMSLGDIKTLCENYINLKIQNMDMIDMATSSSRLQDIDMCKAAPDTDFKLIPVSLPKKAGYAYAKVSNEDFEMVNNLSSKWRISSSGYPIFVTRKGGVFCTTYMHKLIYGDTSRHVNGDRLDNRRENLIKSIRGPPAPRKPKKTDGHLFIVQTEDEPSDTDSSIEYQIELMTYGPGGKPI